MTQQQWNATFYDQKHSYVFEYGRRLLSLLQPQAGETILDLGCGTGHLTNTIAESGATVIGIDNSPEMIALAQSTYPHVQFQLGDASAFTFSSPFDAIFSNATLHWVREAGKAVQCMARAIKPNGRLILEFGGKGNVAIIVDAVQQTIRESLNLEVDSAWYFPSIGEYSSLLEQYGFEVQSALLFDRPTQLEGDQGVKNWVRMFGGNLLSHIPAELQERALDRVEEITRDRLFREGRWFADYRRLRITAVYK